MGRDWHEKAYKAQIAVARHCLSYPAVLAKLVRRK